MRRAPSASERLIIALDVDNKEQAIKIVETLGDAVSFYKVGWQLFGAGHGRPVVNELVSRGKKVFVDLKIDDTPRTVETAVRNLAIDGVQFFTLQGNGATAKAAAQGRQGKDYPKFLQVTLLSSWDASDLMEYLHIDKAVDVDEIVLHRARKILDSGCEGVIASGTSVRKLRKMFPKILIVSPGIRPAGSDANDHKRTLTPYDAIMAGADYLVVGRPIRDASDPVDMAKRIRGDIERALKDTKKGETAEYRAHGMTPATAH